MITSLINNNCELNPRTALTNEDVLNIRNQVYKEGNEALIVYQTYKDIISYSAFEKMLRGET